MSNRTKEKQGSKRAARKKAFERREAERQSINKRERRINTALTIEELADAWGVRLN